MNYTKEDILREKQDKIEKLLQALLEKEKAKRRK